MSGEKDFLSRWSSRKLDAREKQEAPAPETDDPASTEAPPFTPEELETLSDAELCERLELPDPASLEKGDDFSAFLNDQVPERLKRVALRRLWRTDPVLACVDGLNDYDEDFTSAEAVGDAVRTMYRVGKGYLQPEGEAEPGVAPEDAAIAPADDEPGQDVAAQKESAPEADSTALSVQDDQDGQPATSTHTVDAEPESDCDRPPQITSRRMTFRFVEKSNTDE